MTGARFALFADSAGFYARGLTREGAMCWRRDGDQWVACRGEGPDGAREVGLADVPADLQEESLAGAARSEVMGGQNWNNPN